MHVGLFRQKLTNSGFTMIEFLLIIVIIGILTALMGFNYTRGIRSAELREAATQVATDLRRAKATAQRQSLNVSLTFSTSSAAAGDKKSYSVTVGAAATQRRTLDKGITVQCRQTGGNCGTGTTMNISYQAPYGELAAIGNVLELRSPVSGITPLEVRIVGVTGKVIVTEGTP